MKRKTVTALQDRSSRIRKEGGRWILQLFVAGNTAKSAAAIHNITHVCERFLKGNYQLEVIDLRKRPERAYDNQIVALPALVRSSPLPKRNIIGDLSNTERLMIGLDLSGDRMMPPL